jgi:hypothetical protein
MRFKMLANWSRCHFVPLPAITSDVRRPLASVPASSCLGPDCRVVLKTVSLKYVTVNQRTLSNQDRWHVHRCSWHHRIWTRLQHHRSPHFDHGACFPNSKGAYGQYLQLAMESGCYCSCLDDVWHLPHHEQLGLADPVYPSSTVQHCSNRLLLVDRRIASMARKQRPLRRGASNYH